MHVSVIGRLVGMATRVGAHPATRGGGLLQHRGKARSPGLAACGGLVLIAMMTGGVGLLSGVGPASGVTWASAQGSCDSWVGPVTGTVSGSIGSYWSMGVPTKGVPVCINQDGTYTVVMNNQPHAFVEVGELQIGAASGNPTLEVTGANGNVELHLDAGATVGGNGTHGTLALDTIASVDYLAEVTGAKGAALTVSSGGKLLVSGPLGSPAAATIAVPLTNQVGGKVDIAGSTNMGMGEVTVVNSGTFDIARRASSTCPRTRSLSPQARSQYVAPSPSLARPACSPWPEAAVGGPDQADRWNHPGRRARHDGLRHHRQRLPQGGHPRRPDRHRRRQLDQQRREPYRRNGPSKAPWPSTPAPRVWPTLTAPRARRSRSARAGSSLVSHRPLGLPGGGHHSGAAHQPSRWES